MYNLVLVETTIAARRRRRTRTRTARQTRGSERRRLGRDEDGDRRAYREDEGRYDDRRSDLNRHHDTTEGGDGIIPGFGIGVTLVAGALLVGEYELLAADESEHNMLQVGDSGFSPDAFADSADTAALRNTDSLMLHTLVVAESDHSPITLPSASPTGQIRSRFDSRTQSSLREFFCALTGGALTETSEREPTTR